MRMSPKLAAPAVARRRLLHGDLAADTILRDGGLDRLAAGRHHVARVRERGADGAGAARPAGLERGDVPRLLVHVRGADVVLAVGAGVAAGAELRGPGRTPVPAVLHPQPVVLEEAAGKRQKRAVKRPARPHRSPIESRTTAANAEAAEAPRAGPDRVSSASTQTLTLKLATLPLPQTFAPGRAGGMAIWHIG